MTEPTTSQTVSDEQIQPLPSQNIDIPVPAQIPTGSFSLLDENEISDTEPIENFFSRNATSLKRKNSKETEESSSQTYTTTVQTVSPSPPTEQSLVLTQPTQTEEEKAHLLTQSKRLSDIMKKYLGADYLSKVQDVDINLIEKGNFNFFYFLNFQVHGEISGRMVYRQSLTPFKMKGFWKNTSGTL